MLIPGRWGASEGYRYGFQGQEMDNEQKGTGNMVNYKFRMHDARIGRFFSVDPLTAKYPFYSPYAFSGNRVVDAFELEGLEPVVYQAQKGDTQESISKQFGISSERLGELNPGADYSAGSNINIADPNSWHFPDQLQNWINSGAKVNGGDLFYHPANRWGSEEAAWIMSDLSDAAGDMSLSPLGEQAREQADFAAWATMDMKNFNAERQRFTNEYASVYLKAMNDKIDDLAFYTGAAEIFSVGAIAAVTSRTATNLFRKMAFNMEVRSAFRIVNAPALKYLENPIPMIGRAFGPDPNFLRKDINGWFVGRGANIPYSPLLGFDNKTFKYASATARWVTGGLITVGAARGIYNNINKNKKKD